MQTMKVKPWADGQGDHVLINAEDFDADVHEALNPGVAALPAEPASQATDEPQTAPARRGRKPKAE